MKLLIGKLLPDGTIRYISLNDGREVRRVAEIVRVFYSREHRLDALLDLGDLVTIGPTPYGKNTHREDDYLHCYAQKRDNHNIDTDYDPRITDNKEIYIKLNDWVMLWEQGEWFLYVRDIRRQITSDKLYVPAPGRLLHCVKVRCFDAKGSLSISDKKFERWKELEAYAAHHNITYYLFEDQKLIKVVNNPLTGQSHE